MLHPIHTLYAHCSRTNCLNLKEVKSKKPRIDGEALALGSSEHSSPNAKKKRKNNTDKENDVQSSESKQVKKQKKKRQKPEIATAEA